MIKYIYESYENMERILLNDKVEYLKIIDTLENLTSYIEIVVLDGKISNSLIELLKRDIIAKEKVKKWWGTETCSSINNLYRIKASKELFMILRKYDTFCKYIISNKKNKSDEIIYTNFGIDDISFYSSDNQYLLTTTTHEGMIFINKEYLDI